MELLGDEAQVEARFGLLDIVLILTQDRCTVSRQTYHRLRNRLTHPMVLLGDDAQVEARFGPFGDSANPEAR